MTGKICTVILLIQFPVNRQAPNYIAWLQQLSGWLYSPYVVRPQYLWLIIIECNCWDPQHSPKCVSTDSSLSLLMTIKYANEPPVWVNQSWSVMTLHIFQLTLLCISCLAIQIRFAMQIATWTRTDELKPIRLNVWTHLKIQLLWCSVSLCIAPFL